MSEIFESAEQIDEFIDNLGIMLAEFAQLYRSDDPRHEKLGDTLERYIADLAAIAKTTFGTRH
jgi:hypothetical protein